MAQSILFSQVNLWGARPDMMLLVVLAWSLVRGTEEGVVWGFVGGLMIDLFSGGPVGMTALALVAVAFLAGQPWGEGLGFPLLRILLLALSGIVIYHLLVLLTLALFGYTVDWGFSILRVAGPSALLNLALVPFVHQPLAWLERKTRREGFNP